MITFWVRSAKSFWIKVDGRESEEDITLFKSLGLAVEDVAAAHHIYQKLTEQGGGRWIEFNAKKLKGPK